MGKLGKDNKSLLFHEQRSQVLLRGQPKTVWESREVLCAKCRSNIL